MVHTITVVIDESTPGCMQAMRNLQRGALKDHVTKVSVSHARPKALSPIEQIRDTLRSQS